MTEKLHPVRSRLLENQRSALRLLVSTADHELAFMRYMHSMQVERDDIPQLKMFTAL